MARAEIIKNGGHNVFLKKFFYLWHTMNPAPPVSIAFIYPSWLKNFQDRYSEDTVLKQLKRNTGIQYKILIFDHGYFGGNDFEKSTN